MDTARDISNEIIHGLDNLSDSISQDFYDTKKSLSGIRRGRIVKISSIAASLALAFGIAFAVIFGLNQSGVINNPPENPVSTASHDPQPIGSAVLYLDPGLYKTESDLYVSSGRIRAGYAALNKLNDESVDNSAVMAVSFLFCSEDCSRYIAQESQKILEKYEPLFREIEEQLSDVSILGDKQLISQLTSRQSELLILQESEIASVKKNAEDLYFSELCQTVSGVLGQDIVVKDISFGHDGSVSFTKTFRLSYVRKADLAALLNSAVCDDSWGVSFELAPEFIDWPDDIIDLRDPYFDNMEE